MMEKIEQAVEQSTETKHKSMLTIPKAWHVEGKTQLTPAPPPPYYQF